ASGSTSSCGRAIVRAASCPSIRVRILRAGSCSNTTTRSRPLHLPRARRPRSHGRRETRAAPRRARRPRRATGCQLAARRPQHGLRARRAKRDPASPVGQGDPFQPRRGHVMVVDVMAGREGRPIEMAVRRDTRTGRWLFRATVTHADGTSERLSGTPGALGPYHDLANSKLGAQEAEGRAIAAARKGKAMAGTSEQKGEGGEKKKELPTFSEWFHGRFWTEHVI